MAFADNLSSNDPPLGHTDAPTNAIYNINVTDIVGTDHHGYISPSFMEQVIKHWDHRSMFDKNGTLDYSPNSFCYPGIQDCNKGNILLKILNGSSLCNPSVDDCSSQSIVAANLEFLKNRHLLTTKAENEAGQQELSKVSNLFNEVFQGNTTAVSALFDAFNTLTKSSSSVNQTQ